MPLLGCYLIVGFVIQLVVALLDLKSGNLAGGNTFLYFSAYFMLVSGAEMLLKYFVPGLDGRIDGWARLLCGILGLYLAAVTLLNASYGKTVLPNPAPLYGRNKRT